MDIIIDAYRCSGCATCVELCPEVFALDPHTEKAMLLREHPEPSDDLHQAVAYCPEKCILMEEDSG